MTKSPFGKLCPGMDVQIGMQLLRETRCGNGVPESAFETGRSFPYKQNKARCLRLMQTARLLRWASLRFEVVACDL